MTYFDKKQREIIKQVAALYNLPEEVVALSYYSTWEFIKNKIEELPLKEDLDKESFDKLRTSFNLPSLGKIYANWKVINSIQKRINNFKNKNDVRVEED